MVQQLPPKLNSVCYLLNNFFLKVISSGIAAHAARNLQLVDERGNNLAASSGGIETTRIEQTRGKLK